MKKLWIPIALAAAGGGLILWNVLKKKKQDKSGGYTPDVKPDTKTVTSSGTGTTVPAPVGTFPLKRGSKGAKVKELQQAIGRALLPKYFDDGDFGSETETAVIKLLNKSSVDNQSDIEKIKALQTATATEQKKYNAGMKLLMAFKANVNQVIMPVVTTKATKVNVNYQNDWIFTNQVINLPKNLRLSRADYVLKAISGAGNMLMEITKGALVGYYVINPLDITLVTGTGTAGFNGNNADSIIWD